MNPSKQIARHFRAVFFGGNWTDVNLKDTLADVTWQQATTKVDDVNTIAVLVFHIHYYVSAVLKVLQGEPLTASDKFAFDLPPVQSEKEWQDMVTKMFRDAENFAGLIEQFDAGRLDQVFFDEKYGNYYHNFHGIVEHTHYHLGQIVLIKKLSNR